MKYFCTLSDKNFLAKGLALYKSLAETSKEPFRLYYLALDQESFKILSGLEISLSNLGTGGHSLIPVSLQALEEEELRTARSNRPYNEYCWTLASYFTHHLLSHENIEHIAYIDSDIYFYDDIDLVYKEFGARSVGLITHRHNALGHSDGAYNVGVIYFNKDKMGEDCLFWWKDAVLNKKYPQYYGCGDQRYLEGFAPLIGAENVCSTDNSYGHGAPWNYRLYSWDDFLTSHTILWNGKKQPFVFNHFSRLSYNLKTDEINPTSGCYSDHTLNNEVFKIVAVQKLYADYYCVLKEIHMTWLKTE